MTSEEYFKKYREGLLSDNKEDVLRASRDMYEEMHKEISLYFASHDFRENPNILDEMRRLTDIYQNTMEIAKREAVVKYISSCDSEEKENQNSNIANCTVHHEKKFELLYKNGRPIVIYA